MSVSGLCQVCEASEARFACAGCGKVVCADHYDRELGRCVDCARVARGGSAEPPGGGADDSRPGRDETFR